MQKRSTESPMDFEWQGRGPGDVTSPFYQLGMSHDNQKKRPHSVFDSPAKKPFPSLREPNSQSFLFPQPPPQHRTASPSRQDAIFGKPAFTTPRKFEVDVDFSSGAENFSSPDNADNDDTPEPKKEKRNSLFGLYGRFAASPGRGEIPRLNNYSNAAARRVQKRRRRDRDLDRRLRKDLSSDDESDRSGSRGGKRETRKQQQSQQAPSSGSGAFSSFASFIEQHPNMPSILSWWAQLGVNMILISLFVYVTLGMLSTIRAEFNQAAEDVSNDILAEMAVCAKSFVDNKCGGGERLPALETVCENWGRCMNRDPAKVGRAKVSAQTMAHIINGFVDPISWKAIFCFLATIATLTVASNWSFRSFRRQQEHMQGPQPSGQPMQPQHLPLPYSLEYGRTPGPSPVHHAGYEQKQNEPLMIENTPSKSMDFVTMRTPSPTKRRLF